MRYGGFYLIYDEMLRQDYGSFISGCAAAVICWPLAYPFDVLRTRAQSIVMKTHWSRDYWTFGRTSDKLFTKSFSQWFPGIGKFI